MGKGTAVLCVVLALWFGPGSGYAADDALHRALDPGGVAFEWPSPGAWNGPRKALSDNLLKGGDAEGDAESLRKTWHTSSWLGSKTRGEYPLPGKPTSDLADGLGRGGGRAFHLLMSPDGAPIVTACWYTDLVADQPGPYRISGWAKCGPGSPGGDSLEIVFQSRRQSGQLCGEAWQAAQASKKTLVAIPSGDWAAFHVDVMAMPEIARASLILAQRGPGEVYVDDLSITRMAPDSDIHVIARSTGPLDGTVAIGSQELSCAAMWAQNESQRKIKSPRLELDLPEGVHLVAPDKRTQEGLREDKTQTGDETRIRASIPWTVSNDIHWKSFFAGPSQLYCLLADLPPRPEPYRACARFTAEGYEGPWWEFKLLILPRIDPVAPPKRFILAGAVPNTLEGRAAREWVATLTRWGANAALCWNEGDDLRSALAESKLHMVNIDWFWRNNFQFMHKPWTKALVPQDGWWVGRDGGPWGMCPELIAQGATTDAILKPYYRKIFVEGRLYDFWCTNWEPDLWVNKGCFCPRCKKAFAQFAGLPETDVAPLDGKALTEKYPEKWRDYRRDLNNRLMRLAYRIFDDLGKERGRPIPAFLAVSPSVIAEPRGEMDLRPVLRDCECISSWSYEGVDISEGPKGIVNHRKVAEQTEQTAQAIHRQNRRPDFKYFHCLLGSFGSYVTTPEEMELDLLSSALARPWGLKVWDFPMSYDYRYARAFARAARLIAAHEEIIHDGQQAAEVPIAPLSPTHQGEETRKDLWARIFARDGKRLYAIFNFDRRNRVFFTLKPDGGSPSVLHDPVNRVLYEPESSGDYCLHLGAARAMFLLWEPQGADPARWQGYDRIASSAIRAAMR